jgi:hypothetical protein
VYRPENISSRGDDQQNRIKALIPTLTQILVNMQKIAYAKANTTLGGKKDSTASGKRKRDVDDDAGAMAPSMRVKGEQVLVVQNLPSEVGETSLVPVFSQCTGFTEVRMAPGSKGLAFVEFSDEVQASMALKQLQGFQITESYSLDISVGNGK